LFVKTHNKNLPFIIPDWKGNPVTEKGRFVNLDGPSERSYQDVLKWQRNRKEAKAKKKKQFCNVEVVSTPDVLSHKEDGIFWFGHCTFLIQVNGVRIITDPIFYSLPLQKRHTAMPCKVKDIVDIDYILLSHNHYDHADRRSMTRLAKNNPKAVVLTAIGLEPLLRNWRLTNTIQDAGWYQQYKTQEGLKISFLPSKHWCRRKVADTNKMLWGSFMIEAFGKTIYFGADSGAGIHFGGIAKLFPSIDYCMLGIGAYEPTWFMHTSHTSPADAVQAFGELQANKMIPMHYGTFDLSDEPMQEPVEKIQSYKNRNILPMKIGEWMPL
jgi:L-ascorbate metabolism protein UlaG (beta-lactamase superfamily)